MPPDFMQYGVFHINDEMFIQKFYLESKQDFIQNSSRNIGDNQRIKTCFAFKGNSCIGTH